MKSKMMIFSVIISALSISKLALAQTTDQPMRVVVVDSEVPKFKNRLSAAPLSLLLGIGNFTYERAIGDHLSLDISPAGVYMNFGEDEVYGGVLGLGASVYLTGSAPQGLKFSANVAPGMVGVNGNEEVFMLFAKATFGYNWIWSSGFSMGLAAGAQYVHFEDADNEVDSPLRGVLPTIDFNLGFAF